MNSKFSAIVGAGGAAIGAIVWGVTVAITTPRAADLESGGDFSTGQLIIWAQELRQAAIVLAACGFLLCFERFRGALAIVVAGAGILLVGDVILTAHDVAGLGAAVSIAAGAGIVGLVAFGLIPLTKELDEVQRTRRRAGLAIVAAYCAPAALYNSMWGAGNDVVPWQFTAGTAIVAASLTALSVVCVMSVSTRYRPFATLACAVPAVVVGGFFGVSAEAGVALSLPFAAAAIIAMRDATSTAFLRKLWARVVFLLGAVILAVPSMLLTIVPATTVGEPLLKAGGDSMPADGLPYLPGALALAVAISIVALLRRSPKRKPDVQPSTPEPEAPLAQV